MPLQLPNFDDRNYQDLLEEALRLIPTFSQEWTNYNPSDPGITLVELFAYLTEMLLYRQNRVTDQNMNKLLKLLNGPDWVQRQDLQEELRKAVLGIRSRYRAVTCEDFEFLSINNFNNWLAQMRQKEQAGSPLDQPDEWWVVTGLDAQNPDNLPSNADPIGRAYCVPQRYLEASSEADRQQPRPECISMIILPSATSETGGELGPQPTSLQCRSLWGYLDQRRMLTTRHYVVGPFYAPVMAEILVARRTDVSSEKLRGRILDAVGGFLNPLPNDQKTHEGWPFGRDVYVSEIYELLEKVDGVDFISDIMLASDCQTENPSCVAAEAIWHRGGDLIGLRLYDHHLPSAHVDPDSIVIVPNVNFLSVQLQVTVESSSDADSAILKRQIKQTLRVGFHPLHEGPKPNASTDTPISLQDLQQVVAEIGGVQQVVSLSVQTSPTRLQNDVLVIKAGEVVDLHLQVELREP